MVTVEKIIEGYGPDFAAEYTLDTLFEKGASALDKELLDAPLAMLGRYRKNVEFFIDLTSGKRVGLERFNVMIEYFIFLSDELTGYDGVFADKKVVEKLTDDQKNKLRNLATTLDDVIIAEILEKFSGHDTAAAGDYLKLLIGTQMPELEPMIEGIHFAATSEDVMGIVFGIINNELLYKHLLPSVIDFCTDIMSYVAQYEYEQPIVMPGLTHQQAAEPTTMGNKFLTTIGAIDFLVNSLRTPNGEFQRFSGKMGGAIGNLTTHYVSYPDIDWINFAQRFVEGQGLHYEEMTNQAVTYVVESRIYSTINNMLDHMLKFTNDFLSLASAPGQLFVKKKKKGQKGSSIMPNKSNAWGMEGARKMFKESKAKLDLYSRELPDYPNEGDMGRSNMMRNIADVFMPMFIGMARVRRELKAYYPHQGNIDTFFDKYPGMSGSAIQTILKREGIEGDAYRVIQDIALNPDGSSANAEQFGKGLETAMISLGLSSDVQDELRRTLNPAYLAKSAHMLAERSMTRLNKSLQDYTIVMNKQFKFN